MTRSTPRTPAAGGGSHATRGTVARCYNVHRARSSRAEQRPHKAPVPGSNPGGPTTFPGLFLQSHFSLHLEEANHPGLPVPFDRAGEGEPSPHLGQKRILSAESAHAEASRVSRRVDLGLKAARFWCRIVPMAMAVQTDLLERAPFLAELGQRLEESREAGRLVLLGGEAGVGKTALLRRFCLLHRDSAQALWGAF